MRLSSKLPPRDFAEAEDPHRGAGPLPEPSSAAPPSLPLELVDPFTGEILDRKDRDSLISAFDRSQKKDREIFAWKRELAQALVALTTGEAKTRRVLGKTRCAKVEMPDNSIDQGKLKEAWGRFPQHRGVYLRIGSIEINKREWKKAVETSGEPGFESFKDLVKSAIRPPTASPRITVEK